MNLKMLTLCMAICCLALLPKSLYSQCTSSPNPDVEMVFGSLPYALPFGVNTIPLNDEGDIIPGIPDLSLCRGRSIQLFIIPQNSATYTFPCSFEFHLDELGENDITLTSIGSGNISDGWSIVSGQGTAHPVLQFSGSVSNEIYILSLRVDPSCDLFDLITSGETEEIENNQFSVEGCYNNGGGSNICIETISESFNLIYNLVTLQEGNTVTTVDLGEEFTMTKEMEVSGDVCVNSFQTYITVPPTFDLSNLEVKIQMVITSGQIQALVDDVVPANDVSVQGNLICITIDDDYTNLNYDYCNEHFPGGMGEIRLTLCNLEVEECPAGAVTWRTNSCKLLSPFGCVEPNSACYPQSESTCYVNVPNGDPELDVTINNQFQMDLDFCEEPGGGFFYSIFNNSDDVAYNVQFKINNWQWMNIEGLRIRGRREDGSTFIFFDLINNSPYDPGVITFLNNNSDVTFNFNNLMTPNLGLFDVNGDGVFSELGPNQGIDISLTLSSSCPFGDIGGCPDEFDPFITVWRGEACWDNQCGTNPEDDVVQGTTSAIADPSGAVVNCPGTLDVEPGQEFTFDFCAGEWDVLPDFDENFFDLGQMTSIIQVDVNAAMGVTPICLTFEGTTHFPVEVAPDIFEFDLGVTDLPPADGDGLACMELKFEFECPSIPFDGPLNIGVQLLGEWECDDPVNDCRIQLGCGGAEFYPQCPCEETDPECEFCDLMEATNFNAIRPTAPPGGNFCGAYVCDPIDMTLTGTVSAGYNGPIGGYFTMEIFDPSLDLVSSLSVTALLNGNPINVGPVTASGFPVRCYEFQTDPVNVTATSTIQFFISGIADKDGIENMPVFAYTINNFIGGLSQFVDGEFQKCVESDISTVFQLYRVDAVDRVIGASASCNNGITLTVEFGYRGGTIGDEFPNEYRPINRLDGVFEIEVLSPASGVELASVQQNGGMPISLSGTLDDFTVTNLSPVPDKTMFEEFTERVVIRAVADCTLDDNTPIEIAYRFTQKHNLFAGGPPCTEDLYTPRSRTMSFQKGDIATTPSNPNIVTYSGNSIDGSSAPLEICFNAIDHASDITWAQFTYPEGALNIQFNGDEGSSCPSGGGLTTEWFPIPEGIDQVGGCLTFDYEVLSCEMTEISLGYAIGQACYDPDYDADGNNRINDGELAALLADVACDSECLTEGEFNIEIEPSGLIATIDQCNTAQEPCDEITFALVVENPGGGITSDISLDVDLPASMELVSATFQHPYGVGLDPCAGNPTQVINGADNGPVVFLNQLEGVQTASSDAQRRILIHATVRFNECPDVDLLDNALRFTVSGQRNCGEEISFVFDQYEDLVNSFYLDFSADLLPNPVIERDCKDGVNTGLIFLEIGNWMPPTGTLPPGQSISLFISGLNNVVPTIPSPINIAYGQTQVVIPYTFTGKPCDDGSLLAVLRSSSDISCNGEECFDELIDIAVYTIPGSDGTLSITEVQISEDICIQDEAGVLVSVFSPTNDLNGEEITLEVFCDDGTGNPTGPAIFTTTHILNLIPGSGGFIENISIVLPSDDILNTCNGQIVVVISTEDACICFERPQGTAEACCEYCPEVSLRAECLGENTWRFTVVPDVPNLAVNYVFVGGDPSGAFTTDNPFVVTFNTLPSEVCATIFSDEATNCDTLDFEDGVQVANVVEQERVTACDTLICMPLDECYADGNFTCDLDFNGKFWTLDVEGIVSTNLNNFQVGWMINGVFQSVSGLNAQLVFTQPGEYEVCMVVNGIFYANCQKPEPCKIKICKTIKVTKDPKECWVFADFSYAIGGEGNIIFTNNSTYNGDRVEYFWDFGDRNTSTEVNPVHRYRTIGRYEVTLLATAYSGEEICEDRITITVDFGVDGKGGRPRAGDEEFDQAKLGAFQSSVFPNPAWESVNFSWQGEQQQSGTVEVFNISGQRVFLAEMKADAEGNNSISIPVDQWGPGMYLLRFEGEHDSATHRFIVE